MSRDSYFAMIEEAIDRAANETATVGGKTRGRRTLQMALVVAAALLLGIAVYARDDSGSGIATVDLPTSTTVRSAESSASTASTPPELAVRVERIEGDSPLAFRLEVLDEPPETTARLVVLLDGVLVLEVQGGPYGDSPTGFGRGDYPSPVQVTVEATDADGQPVAMTEIIVD